MSPLIQNVFENQELASYIIILLDLKQAASMLCKISCVSSKLRNISDADENWKILYNKRWPKIKGKIQHLSNTIHIDRNFKRNFFDRMFALGRIADWDRVDLSGHGVDFDLSDINEILSTLESSICSLADFGECICCGFDDSRICLVEKKSFQPVPDRVWVDHDSDPSYHNAALSLVAWEFAPLCRLIVCGYEQGGIRVWDMDTGTVLAASDEHSGAVTGLLLLTPEGERSGSPTSAAGPLLLSGSADGTAKVWDLASAAAIPAATEECKFGWASAATLSGHTGGINDLTACGPAAVSASDDGSLRVRREAVAMPPPPRAARAVAQCPPRAFSCNFSHGAATAEREI